MEAFKRQAKHYTLEAYRQLEAETGRKHEFHNGEVYMMSGGTIVHAEIVGNVFGELRDRLKGKTCRPFTSELKTYIKTANRYVYPDASVVCGKIETSPDEKEAVTNPVLIVEVLSKSTADYDRSEKFFHYRRLASLKEYLLVHQDRPVVELFTRTENDSWFISRIEGLEASVSIPTLDIELPLTKLFENVDFRSDEEVL